MACVDILPISPNSTLLCQAPNDAHLLTPVCSIARDAIGRMPSSIGRPKTNRSRLITTCGPFRFQHRFPSVHVNLCRQNRLFTPVRRRALLEVSDMGQAFPMKNLPLSMTIRGGLRPIDAPRFGKPFAMARLIGKRAVINPVVQP